DDDVLIEETKCAPFLGGRDLDAPRRHPSDLARQLEGHVVDVGLEIAERAVARMTRRLHRRRPSGVRILRTASFAPRRSSCGEGARWGSLRVGSRWSPAALAAWVAPSRRNSRTRVQQSGASRQRLT